MFKFYRISENLKNRHRPFKPKSLVPFVLFYMVTLGPYAYCVGCSWRITLRSFLAPKLIAERAYKSVGHCNMTMSLYYIKKMSRGRTYILYTYKY